MSSKEKQNSKWKFNSERRREYLLGVVATQFEPDRYFARFQEHGQVHEICATGNLNRAILLAEEHYRQHGLKTWVWCSRTGAYLLRRSVRQRQTAAAGGAQ